jgi:hypothetical protein
VSENLERDRFHNACRILLNIDKDELEKAGVMALDQVGGSDWDRFNRDPLMFMLKLPTPRFEALWSLIEDRQPERLKA